MSASGRPALPRGPLAILFAAVFVDMVGFGLVLPVLPLWAEEFGASPTTIGLLAASYAVAQFAMAPVWGRLSDRYGRRPILLGRARRQRDRGAGHRRRLGAVGAVRGPNPPRRGRRLVRRRPGRDRRSRRARGAGEVHGPDRRGLRTRFHRRPRDRSRRRRRRFPAAVLHRGRPGRAQSPGCLPPPARDPRRRGRASAPRLAASAHPPPRRAAAVARLRLDLRVRRDGDHLRDLHRAPS